jgi:regulator of RNase E activity RraA
VVVDGAARDIDKARGIGFPVFARATVASTARGRVAEYATNAPIVVGGVTVKPGDMVIAGEPVTRVLGRSYEAMPARRK